MASRVRALVETQVDMDALLIGPIFHHDDVCVLTGQRLHHFCLGDSGKGEIERQVASWSAVLT